MGDLGPSSRAFLEWLASAGFSAWQVLPLAVAGPYGCPYSSPASAVGDPLLISLDDLVGEGLLQASELPAPPAEPVASVDFGEVERLKRPALERGATQLLAQPSHPLAEALENYRSHSPGLGTMSLFRVLHRAREGRPWWTWEEALKWRSTEAIARARQELAREIAVEETLAFLFAHQWRSLRARADVLGISLVGDLPIYVAADSADVWANPALFELMDDGRPSRVAGVPADAFAPLGQRWGNPLYKWETHAKDNFGWWCRRVARARDAFDLVRLDHFRGFASYYAIDASSPDGREGVWLPGPGRALFAALEESLGAVPFIAEDLGFVTADVEALRLACDLPSMRVLQFGLDGQPDNPHAPANIPADAVVYTGTHDNATSQGWFDEASPDERSQATSTLDCEPADFVESLVQAALESPAQLAVVPVQDLLGLGNQARMNIPGTATGNWDWRLSPGQLTTELALRATGWLRAAGRSE